MKFSKIMVGVEESPDALKAFHYAIQKAKEEQAELVIVSILEEKEIKMCIRDSDCSEGFPFVRVGRRHAIIPA